MIRASLAALAITLFATTGTTAQTPPAGPLVNADNFIRAESDLYFGNFVKEGGIGRLFHRREPASIDHQTVIRLNRDTLYSSMVLDLDSGPATVTLPDAGKRFMSMMVLDEDHYVVAVEYAPGPYSITKEKVGTRYAAVAVRIFVDPGDPKDIQATHALQDAIKVEQQAPGRFEVPAWDAASQKKVRDALLSLASSLPTFNKAFGRRGEVDPVHHLIGTAAGWGGNPDKDATYLSLTPANNDGKAAYRVTVRDVPVDGFWSVSVYNAQGYFEKNALGAYSLNNVTAKKEADGAIVIQFGGCDGKTANCLPTVPGWNCTVRLYRPRAEILSGAWKFPPLQPL